MKLQLTVYTAGLYPLSLVLENFSSGTFTYLTWISEILVSRGKWALPPPTNVKYFLQFEIVFLRNWLLSNLLALTPLGLDVVDLSYFEFKHFQVEKINGLENYEWSV